MEIVKGQAEQQLSKRCGLLGIGLNMCSLLEDKKDALSLGWYVVATVSVSQGGSSETLCSYRKANPMQFAGFFCCPTTSTHAIIPGSGQYLNLEGG